jgi:signal transduction histidine kinase
VRVQRSVLIDPKLPRAGILATLQFEYPVDPPLIVLGLASTVLLLIFGLVHRACRRGFELNQLVIQARTQARSRQSLAEQLAHDIKSPLSAMSLTLGHLGEISAAERTLLANAARRIGEIADDLVAPSREPVPVTDLDRVLDDVFAEVRRAHAHRPELKFERDRSETSLGPCGGDAREIARMISNLLINAAEAIAGPGTVTLGADRRADAVIVRVRDDGRGIAPELLPRLGAGRVTSGKVRDPGAGGLGLTHAFRTAAAMRGHVRLISDRGRGTTVVLTLPGPRPA